MHNKLNKTFKKHISIQNPLNRLIESIQFAHDRKYVIFVSYKQVHSLNNHSNIAKIIIIGILVIKMD